MPKIIDSPVFAACMAGIYVSAFYIAPNLTMLPGSSVFVVAFVITAPVVVAVALLCLLLHMLGKDSYAKLVSAFVCAFYILILMRRAVFGIHAIGSLFVPLDAMMGMGLKILFLTAPALLLGWIFRRSIGKFSIVLGAMTIAAFVGNFNTIAGVLTGRDLPFGKEMAKSLEDTTLSRTPNIYFILADGYSSFAYMKEHSIDVGGFRNYLSSNGFHLYDEAFGNYHSTTNAMPAMLNMDHHYYSLTQSHKSGEVRKSARVIIGGKNTLVDVLRRNSYLVQYIHNWQILLLHGCSADYCYGEKPYAGAKLVLGEILPVAPAKKLLVAISPKFGEKKEADPWKRRIQSFGIMRPIEDAHREVVRLIEQNTDNRPTFQYIHLTRPTHAPDSMVGICNENEQRSLYGKRVVAVNDFLEHMIDDIISRDPAAVVVLAGDHGPFIARKCSRWTYLGTLSGYRDRVGVLMAIRWPEGYDGRYDKRIISLVNVFRYVLASLMEDDKGILETVVPDDAFIYDGRKILQILDRGKPLIPPKRYKKAKTR